jgi:hypothetical protein
MGLMFRITSRVQDDDFVLKVEGCLAGAGVEALEGCWRESTGWPWERRLRVDLTDVCHVDEAGRTLMTAMYCAGVELVTKGCVMPELVREIAEAVDAARRH